MYNIERPKYRYNPIIYRLYCAKIINKEIRSFGKNKKYTGIFVEKLQKILCKI